MMVEKRAFPYRCANWLPWFLFFLLFFEVLFHWFVLSKLNIHWDEFHFLSQIYEAKRGDLGARLQTFHVHLFGWVVHVSGQEVDEIIFGRKVMFVLHLATLFFAFLYFRSAGVSAALFALVAYLACNEVMIHGASFRSDPVIGFVFMFCLFLSMRRGLKEAVITGVCFALIVLINLKSVLFIFVFWMIVFLRGQPGKGFWLVHVLSIVGAFLLLFFFHLASLSSTLPFNEPATLLELVGGFLLGGVSQAGLSTLLVSFTNNPLFWVVVIVSLYSLFRTRHLYVPWEFTCVLFFPLMLFYRNAWPYFLPFALFLFLIPLVVFAERIIKFRGGDVILGLLASLLALSCIGPSLKYLKDGTLEQRALIAEVHRLYPTPVPYIDRCGMISSFPMVGPFVSGWEVGKMGQDWWRLTYAKSLIKHPKFLIRNFGDEYSAQGFLSELEEVFSECTGNLCQMKGTKGGGLFTVSSTRLFQY